MSDSAAGPVPGAAPVLEVRAVDKHFAGVHALRAVDFQLRAGEVHALVGEYVPFVILLTALSEKVSFSAVISGNRALSRLDRLGVRDE